MHARPLQVYCAMWYTYYLYFRNPKEQDGEVLPMGSTVEMLSTENPDNDEAEVTIAHSCLKNHSILISFD